MEPPADRSPPDRTCRRAHQLLPDAPIPVVYITTTTGPHRGTLSEWDLQPRRNKPSNPKRAYDRANWEKIGQDIQSQTTTLPTILSTTVTTADLDQAVEKLISSTVAALDRHIPRHRPSPYAKRWFSPALKVQQVGVNQARRRWQSSCADLGPQHPSSKALFTDMQGKRRQWTRTIEKAKAAHWKEYLDKAGEGHLWKAATYMRPRDDYATIPALTIGSEEVVDNEAKAKAFLESFFPKMADADAELEGPGSPAEEIRWEPITELEVYRSIKAAKGTTAPGEDGIPTLVWKNLWAYLRTTITHIFTKSVELGYYPGRWKRARIVVLRKPGKADYTVPGAYRPISLLNTLGKILEAVIAKRLLHWAESHRLLPETQFGGRPGRNTEQALLVLANAVDQAWLQQRSRVVTLIAFDLKGAFNGVNKTSLEARLRAKDIPTIARKWIHSFMEDRHASIAFDDFETQPSLLENAGLAQGSPLSPILFTFFNSDLVDQPVDAKGGASAFIDDYFRWRVGPSAEENLRKLQEEDIPRIEAWARRTGSCFATEKTELIHLTRNKREQNKGEIIMNGKVIKPSAAVKLLGVIFDRELRWKEHVQQVLKRATQVNIALGGLRHLRPEQMRQLYQACVVPVVDYASTVWHNPLKDKTHLRQLATIQRAALIRILSAFRTVSTQALEVESYTLPTRLRLRQRAQLIAASLSTMPEHHPIHEVMDRARARSTHLGHHCYFPLAKTLRTMDLRRLHALETIDHTPLAPWRAQAFAEIEIEPNREQAKENAAARRDMPGTTVFSDASGQQNHLGAAAVALNGDLKASEWRQVSIGSMEHWSVYAAELMAIFYAISLVLQVTQKRQSQLDRVEHPATILSDSMSALQAIRNPSNRSGQRIIRAILQAASEMEARGIPIRLQWVPGHCNDPGNDEADRLAKEAVGPSKMHPFQPLLSREKGFIRKRILNEWRDEWAKSPKGKHLRQIDKFCRQSVPEDCMDRSHGTEHTYSHNYGRVTRGWRRTRNNMVSETTIDVSVELERQ
ncbi:hypothetical protein CBS147353_11740 [Aspergillus niger]|nr:hypothetical protein CBS147353_11740 [Aspergillus niger]